MAEHHRSFDDHQLLWVESCLGIDYADVPFTRDALRRGMDVELEHGTVDPSTDVTGDEVLATAKIALAHLERRADYYDVLERAERRPLVHTEPMAVPV